MGEVWRATDTKLNRDVAIKILPDVFAQDADRMARFTREAQVLAALNHPNIAAIYGVEERALVMELVEGETLHGPLPLDTALNYSSQIASALEAAHEKGIVHRDLKPANIMVTPQGVVKVLDFGLAAVAQGSSGDSTTSPTLTISPTRAGMILGTAGYMSPEQARGKPVDKRADIWAFGVVLYEMLTGEQLFHGETVSDVLAAVLTREPDWNRVPVKVRRLLQRCLEKDPKRRLRDIGDASLLLDEAPLPARPAKTRWPWAVAGVLTLALIVATALLWRVTRPVLRPLERFDIDFTPPDRVHQSLALSSDGRRIAFVAKGPDGTTRLHVRLLDQPNATPVPGTEHATAPFFSPDGQWLAFCADGALKKVLVQGGTAVKLCDAPDVRGGTWGEDGNIIFSPDARSPLYRVADAGGTPQPITRLKNGELGHYYPQVLPGGGSVLFTANMTPAYHEDSTIQILYFESGEVKTIRRGGYYARYSPSGHLLWVQQNSLFAAAVDVDRARLGNAVPVLEELAATSSSGVGTFELSAAGISAAVTGANPGRYLFWVDSGGKVERLAAPPGNYFHLRLSPDGKRLAIAKSEQLKADLWIYEWERGRMFPLTFSGNATCPLWAPDGKHLVFHDGSAFYWVRADSSGQPQVLLAPHDSQVLSTPDSSTPDGKQLVFTAISAEDSSLWSVPLDLSDPEHPKAGKLQPVVSAPGSSAGALSPDGRWLAYALSGRGAKFQVYVQPFPPTGGKWQIADGGARPVWARNGRELFFAIPGGGSILVAQYRVDGGSFVATMQRVWSPPTVFVAPYFYDMAPDGKRAIIAPLAADAQRPAHLTFLLNFNDELRRRVPAGGK
jgi:serine/threonine-protein kinase